MFIFRIIDRITYMVTSPGRSIAFAIQRFRVMNPLSRSMRTLRSVPSRMKYSFRALFTPFQSGISRLTSRLGFGKVSLGGKTASVEPGKRQIRKKRRKRVSGTPARAGFSQIHLVHVATSQRTILHIGVTVGQSETEVLLAHGRHKPVHLRFTLVSENQYGGNPILMTHVAGRLPIRVNGLELRRQMPIHHETDLLIGRELYRFELYAWDRTPTATQVTAGWATHIGPVRQHNEDAIGLYQHADAYMFVIADGVGGGDVGDLISEFAVKYLLAVFEKNVKYPNLHWHDIHKKAFENVNAEVRQFALRYAFTSGTTLTSVVIKDWNATIAHIGDSRLYHWHNNIIRQITTDHTVQIPVEYDTRYPDASAIASPARDVLLKAIGKHDFIQPDLLTVRLQPGDKLLLCTDGVYDQLSIAELSQRLSTLAVEEVPANLIQLANERENKDNASVIALNVFAQGHDEEIWEAAGGDRVFIGYSSAWSLRLAPPRPLHTDHGVTRKLFKKGARLIWAGVVFFVVLMLLGTGLLLWVDYTQVEVIEPPVKVLSPTPSPTPRLSPTPKPTTTRPPAPAVSPIPPTHTASPPSDDTANLPGAVPVVVYDSGASSILGRPE